jgi:adenylate cyclase
MQPPARRAADSIAGDFVREERADLAYVFYGRTLILGLLAVYVVVTVPFTRAPAYLGIITLFFVLGLVPHLLQRAGRMGAWGSGTLLVCDAVLLSVLMIVPNPLFDPDRPVQLTQRIPNFLFLLLFLSGVALSYSPKLVVLIGVTLAVCWSLGFAWLATRPDTRLTSVTDVANAPDLAASLSTTLDPHAVSITLWVIQTVVLLLMSVMLTLVVWRSRRLVGRVAQTESARAALSRYFSPNIVDRLAESTSPFGLVQRQSAVIMFVDIVGFSAQVDGLAPERVVGLLRSFHRRMVGQVFANDGTIDKYIGDCVMATFGTPQPGPRDAWNALACAQAMCAEVARWNAKRQRRGAASIAIGIGLHYGPVVVGNIGDERRLEFGVVGDTVNIASRLERLSRNFAAQVVASEHAITRANDEGCPPDVLRAFDPAGATEIRGRQEPLAIWTLGSAGTPAPLAAA